MQSGRRHRSTPARSKIHPLPTARRRTVAELLERRQLLSTVIVNTLVDSTDNIGSSVVSLRDAINTANANTTPTTITFSPTVFASPQTISLTGTELSAGLNGQTETIVGPATGVTIDGGGLSRVLFVAQGGTVSISNVTIANGNANQDSGGVGGGIFSQGNLALTDVTVSGNTAQGDGGGIESSLLSTAPTLLSLTNVTLYGNVAGDNQGNGGGGLHTTGHATLRDVTIINNTATDFSGGGISVGDTPISIGNSVVAGNAARVGPDVGGAVVSAGHDLIGESDVSTGWIGTDILGSSADPVAPLLGPLAANGGATPTLLPQAGSPLIDQGSNAIIPAGVTTDQRGLSRIYNSTVDIGSVETQPQIIVTAGPAQSTSLLQNRTFNLGTFVVSTATGPYSVRVNWGDGSANTTFHAASVGQLAGQAHQYTTSGADAVTVSVTDATGTVTGSASFTVTVLAADILITPPSAQAAVAGRPVTVTLGSFTSANATGPYAVDVFWGDGSTDGILFLPNTGVITAQSHSFPTAGIDNVTVTVTDAGGIIANSATFQVNVAPVNVVVTAPSPQSALVGVNTSFALGSFTQSNSTAPFTVAVAWGDGTAVTPVGGLSVGTIPSETHTFTSAGIFTTTVVVEDATGAVKGAANFQISVTTGSIQSSTTLAASGTTFAAGQSLTLTATVSPAAATGVVEFVESGTLLGTGTIGTGGIATFTTTTLGVGSYAITANYQGDATYTASASSVVDLFVTPPPIVTFLSLAASTASADTSESVTLTASLAPATLNGVAATGNVIFYLDSTYLATATLQPDGVASYTTKSGLPLGANLLTASYSGDATFASSVATAVPILINSTQPRWCFRATSIPRQSHNSSPSPPVSKPNLSRPLRSRIFPQRAPSASAKTALYSLQPRWHRMEMQLCPSTVCQWGWISSPRPTAVTLLLPLPCRARKIS